MPTNCHSATKKTSAKISYYIFKYWGCYSEAKNLTYRIIFEFGKFHKKSERKTSRPLPVSCARDIITALKSEHSIYSISFIK